MSSQKKKMARKAAPRAAPVVMSALPLLIHPGGALAQEAVFGGLEEIA